MAENFLDYAGVRLALEQCRRATMPELMRR